ncbi:MAG: LysR family transcriptional regulator [Mycolicibacterium sp.]|uniref:LysR family transcriptional regulator n=1 Tax=Mycolicibacterium sp. TaxID=2320850 RepID=UPI003D0AD238
MELRQLEYFIAVAGEMNFTRAAQRLHLVQSALSTSVSKLEKELGVELFDRSKQQIEITPAGELFREHARQVIHAARLAKDSMSSFQGQLSGMINFGSIVSFGAVEVPRILGEFHRAYPLVRIRLRPNQGPLTTYLSALADGSLDLGLLTAPDHFPATVQMKMLSEEPLLFVCRPDHPLAQRARVDVAELAEEELIGFPPDFGIRRAVDNGFAAIGITPRTPYEVATGFGLATSLVRHGLGSIFMPASETDCCPDLRAVPVHPAPAWTIYLAWAQRERLGPASAKLAELLLASAPHQQG